MRTSLSQPPVAWNGMQEFPADEVKATVSKGWVTLRGEVEWQYQKQDAEEVVRRLTGVMGVTNLITVKPSAIPRIGVGGHFREMNDLLLLGVDLVPATVSECAVGGSDLFLRRSMHWIGPFWTVGIHKVSAHVTVALVHEEALTVGSIGRIWASGPGFHDVFRRNQLPRAHDSVANFRFGLTEGRGGAKQKSEQKQCGGFHVGYFSGR